MPPGWEAGPGPRPVWHGGAAWNREQTGPFPPPTASGPAGGETRPHADKPPWPSSGSAWWKVPAGREGRAPRREAHASPGDLRQGLGVPCTPGPAMGGEPQARQADPSSAAMLQRAGRSVPPAPGPRGRYGAWCQRPGRRPRLTEHRPPAARGALPRGPHPDPAARTAASLSASVSTHIFKVRGAWHFILEGRPLGVTAGVIAQLPSPDTALPPRSSQLRDRSRRLRLHGPHGRPGQDGPAGGLGGVRRAQSVSPRPGPHGPDCV